jgi:hypothetical protein
MGISKLASGGKIPPFGNSGPSEPCDVCVDKEGILCVLWSSVIIMEEVIS